MKTKLHLKECSLEVFEHYLGDQFESGKVQLGRGISNPFISYKQNQPSFNILLNTDGSYVYHDFLSGDTGDCLSFVARLNAAGREQAIHLIRKITKN